MPVSLPSEHRALVLDSRESGFQVKIVATPQPGPGSAVVRIAAAGILPYHRETYNGMRSMPFPTPLVGGFGAIGHVAAAGSDAAALKPGQLVYVDCVIRARDDPECFFLSAIYEGPSDGSKKLMRDAWRNGTFAEYAMVPLENCISLDEAKLCHDLEYSLQDLVYMAFLLVPYGGLRDIGLEPGETIIVCPATGFYGSLGVQVATAMGAKVIALGRNEGKLAQLKEDIRSRSPRANIETVRITGDEDKDATVLRSYGTVDAVLDLTPSEGSMSTHTRSAIKALRRGGRVSLMGSIKNIAVPEILTNNITLKGKMMYEREAVVQFVKMLQSGLFPHGGYLAQTKVFQLNDWKEGFDEAAKYSGIGKCVVFAP
ncbi:GroES-like protein [Aspergillus floccosus]